MKAVLTAKVGMCLVLSSVLAVWTLLAAQPVLAHTTNLPTPSCSGLPDDAFFGGSETASITSTIQTPSLGTKRGEGSTTRQRLRYAKITIPALAAGELRVFGPGDSVSDAVLCRGGSMRATSRTSYSSHDSANSAATRATDAATAAGESGASVSTARSALRSAASALTTVANALTAAGNSTTATTASTAATTARDFADDSTNDTAGDFVGPLNNAADALEAARDAFHTPFQIRATVEPGDESYVLVVALPDASATSSPDVQFSGAIEAGNAAARQGLQGGLDAGEVESRSIVITAPGLLTLETRGSTDTVGMFGTNPEVESGGSGGNFKMVLPVEADASAQTLAVEGQTPTTTGPYTLDMDFKVAMGADAVTSVDVADGPEWKDTGIPGDDTILQIDGSADEDYFVFTPSGSGFLTVEATDADGATRDADTSGELYGPAGQIATATGGNGNHFSFRVPVDIMPYLVKVTGTTGEYGLRFTFASATGQSASASTPPAAIDTCPSAGTGANLICPSTGTGQQERDRYLIDIMEPGALYIHATGSTDTRGVLYGPDGSLLGEDDNSASDGINFRIAASVNPGLHIVEVRGKNRQTQGAYGLVTSFVSEDVATPPTPPGTGDDVTDLQAEVARLQRELAACEAPVETDSRGALENPSGGGFRSGIGVISGWVCVANEVEVRIFSDRGILRATLNVGYGTSRPDTVGSCGHSSPDTGFGMTYNFNHLPEGAYTIRAYADDVQIGQEQAFEVVHLTTFAATNTDRFLRDLPPAECRVNDFPAPGEDTFLLWEQSTQNFVIEDAG